MIGQSSEYESRLAAALDVWADARKRAIDDLSEHAANLAQAGRFEDAARILIVSRHLRIKAMNERANAAAVRLRDRLEIRGGLDRRCACFETALCRFVAYPSKRPDVLDVRGYAASVCESP